MPLATPATLITGASAGIGAEFARILAAEGEALLLTARREDRLAALAEELRRAHGGRVEIAVADLTQEDAAGSLAGKAQALGLEIRTLVNNAGFGLRGAFAEQPLDRLIAMLAVNIVALTRLTGMFLPAMIASREGGIINVASTAAFQPGPYMSVYYASKAYVLSFSEALAHEVQGTGVVVTTLCPGVTQSEFAEVAGTAGSRLMQQGEMTAHEVARLAMAGHRAGKGLVITGAGNKLVPLASRLLPRSLVARIVAGLQKS
ncbi:MAG: SDR family NAD(P)-dependent oxidoreductase [Hyphomicrobiales bacterium]